MKKKRGGKRSRKMKERFGMTDMRKVRQLSAELQGETHHSTCPRHALVAGG